MWETQSAMQQLGGLGVVCGPECKAFLHLPLTGGVKASVGEGLNKTKIRVSPSECKDEERKCVEQRTNCNGDKSLSESSCESQGR